MDKNNSQTKNINQLTNDTNKLLKNIIKKQNIELIKQICKDYNRDPKVLLMKYKQGQYN